MMIRKYDLADDISRAHLPTALSIDTPTAPLFLGHFRCLKPFINSNHLAHRPKCRGWWARSLGLLDGALLKARRLAPEPVARELQEGLAAIAAHSYEGAGHLAIIVVGLDIVGDALDALALLEEAGLEVLDLGLELLDARQVLGLERAVCASGWARRRLG